MPTDDPISDLLTPEERGLSLATDRSYHVWNLIAPRLISTALKDLLENKHLYQYVKLQETALAKDMFEAFTCFQSLRTSEKELVEIFSERWSYRERNNNQRPPNPLNIEFYLPRPVWVFCRVCKAQTVFNPSDAPCETSFPSWRGIGKSGKDQRFLFAYECQQCDGGERAVFFVVNEGAKLTLCGRDPMEAIATENCFPNTQTHFVSEALIAHHAGRSLAGVFFLRTFVEQFWRSIPEVEAFRRGKETQVRRATGDELDAIYRLHLADEFKARFPSLGSVYADLSRAMHDAVPHRKAAKVFDSAYTRLLEHFTAKAAFDLHLRNKEHAHDIPAS